MSSFCSKAFLGKWEQLILLDKVWCFFGTIHFSAAPKYLSCSVKIEQVTIVFQLLWEFLSCSVEIKQATTGTHKRGSLSLRKSNVNWQHLSYFRSFLKMLLCFVVFQRTIFSTNIWMAELVAFPVIFLSSQIAMPWSKTKTFFCRWP